MHLNVLVVGDWLVDEYWFLVRHQSEVSSHTGQLHYRIASEPSDKVRDLCGAGLVVRTLYELREYEVNGLKSKIDAMLTTTGIDAEDKKYLVDLSKRKQQGRGHYRLQEIREVGRISDDLARSSGSVNSGITEFSHEIESTNSTTRRDHNKDYELFGAGTWNERDNVVVEHFIHAHCQQGQGVSRAPFSLMPILNCGHDLDATLVNLAKGDPEHATTRCIRAYRFAEDHFDQVHRIDWEPKPVVLKGSQEANVLAEFLRNRIKIPKRINSIVVFDHKKGVINKELIGAIKEGADPDSHWFVRTKSNFIKQAEKNKWPDWLQSILSCSKIELLAIGPEICCRAYPINGLLSDNGRLAQHAYDLISNVIFDKITNKTDGKQETELLRGKVRNVVMTSDKLEVVALLGEFCFVAKPEAEIRDVELRKINWTTAFFAALVHEMLTTNNWKEEEEPCKEMLERAIKAAHMHSGLRIPEVLKLSSAKRDGKFIFDIQAESETPDSKPRMIDKWGDLQRKWDEAMKDCGIIPPFVAGKTEEHRLDLWRASTDLPGYIACIKEKREAIGRIWQKCRSFTQQKDPGNSLSILLEADPAAGKSFLAEKLADRLQCQLVKRDITQMIQREELFDLFDTVANAQAESSKPVFVFVDEINARLGGGYVYGAFLSPLEGGKYMRRGQQIKLRPCIWMFAGTGGSRTADGQPSEKEKQDKLADFMSRLTLIEHIDYQSICDKCADEEARQTVTSKARLEQVYLGAQFINLAFKDVNRIDHDVLELFSKLPQIKTEDKPQANSEAKPKNADLFEAPSRRIRRLAASLENVQYGRVDKSNCSSYEWRKAIAELGLTDDWENKLKLANPIAYVDIDLGKRG